MFELTYGQLAAGITVAWIVVRVIVGIRAGKVSWKRELQLLMVYICILVVARIVNFPWHLENGKIGTMKFDSSKILPLKFNLIPIIHLFDIYEGWQRNLFGNIAMFIPIGIVWPVCFKKLNTVGKTVLAGFGFSLCIEITQLLFYERSSDIDDLILNTAGAAIGALICFGCRRLFSKKQTKKESAES